MRSIALILSAAGFMCALILGAIAAPASAHEPIDVVAANWKFTPNTITVHVGETQTIRVTSSEGVHGLQSDELGVKQAVIAPNKFTIVTFTAPSKPGTYKIHCSIPCGAGHNDMVLTIQVEP
jgi:cytochrome c oxidase subunit II